MLVKRMMLIIILAISLDIFAGATPWTEFELNDGAIIVPVQVNGVDARALISTGWTDTGINLAFLEKNDIKYKKGRKIIIVSTYGEDEETRLIKKINLNLFGSEFPVKGLMPFRNDHFDLVLGMTFFSTYIVQIDYPQKKIRLIDRDSVDMKAIQNVNLRHGTDKRELVMQVDVDDGEKVELKLSNSLSSGMLLDRHFAESRGWIKKYTKVVSTSSEKNLDYINTDVLVLPMIKFGPYPLQDVIVEVPFDGSVSTNISKKTPDAKTGTKIARNNGFDGILGFDILKHFVITLDAKTARMHIIAP